MEKVYKFLKYTKQQGAGTALRKTKDFVGRKFQLVKRPIDVMVGVEDVIKADFIDHRYRVPEKVAQKEFLKIAWVISPLTAGSGGQNTIVRFARYLKEKGHSVTFYIYEGVQPQSVSQAKKILVESFHITVDVRKISDYQEADALLATGWETAYPVFNLKTNAHKFYFIQDFEPFFYGLGSKSILAENTYKMGFYGITAGKWLTHRVSTQYGMQADYFDFGADLDTYRPKQFAPRKKKIVFYARPVTERRAFELGVIALSIFHQQHPDYTIEFMGWDISDYKIPFPFVNRGILSHDELAVLYQESVACLVLSLTNVSLLPLELLAAGCIPVMNEGENNSMVLGDNEFITYAPATPIQLAEALGRVVEHADIDERAKDAAESVKGSKWEASYQKMETILKREILN